MRVLQITGGVNSVGGTETLALRMCDFLAQSGHETVLITGGKPPSNTAFSTVTIDNIEYAPDDSDRQDAEKKVLQSATEFAPAKQSCFEPRTTSVRMRSAPDACSIGTRARAGQVPSLAWRSVPTDPRQQTARC
jgi:hypothetical protein